MQVPLPAGLCRCYRIRMDMKIYIWGGMFAGSGIGSLMPLLWGDSPLSISSVLLTFVGGVLGIWAGYQIGKDLGA